MRYLPETISSILNQTFRDFELIVVDDGSEDGTPSYVASLEDPRVRCVELPHTGNIARVRNAGAAEASGRYLSFLDSDDLWKPERLEVQLAVMGGRAAAWSYTAFEMIDERGRGIPIRSGHWRALSGDIVDPLIRTEATVAHETVLVERSLFQRVGGFDEDPELLREDFEFTVRLALAAPALAIPEVLLGIRDHSERRTRGWAGPAPFIASAYAYTKLLGVLSVPAHRRAAHGRRAYHFAKAAARFLEEGALGSAASYALRALLDATRVAVDFKIS